MPSKEDKLITKQNGMLKLNIAGTIFVVEQLWMFSLLSIQIG
jgi:hypothetical protein